MFKRKLAYLKELRTANDDISKRGIRKALHDANSYIVGEAAALAQRRSYIDLVPELLVAYDRLFDPTPDNPNLSLDPLASGKRAIAKALKDLGFRESGPFLRGLSHVQREAAFGGKIDVAAELRCICAQALVACDDDPTMLLERLVAHLIDPEISVRIETARAIGAIGGAASVLLLRLKAIVGDKEPAVTGECLRALLSTSSTATISFVADFVRASDDYVRVEAFAALAESRDPSAFNALRALLSEEPEVHVRRGAVLAIGACPLPQAAEFLLSLVASEPRELALAALAALGASRFASEARERAKRVASATSDPSIYRAFAAAFRADPSRR